jgi:hypothetical protein
VKYIPYIYNLLNGQDNIISDIRITRKGWLVLTTPWSYSQYNKKKYFVIKSRWWK